MLANIDNKTFIASGISDKDDDKFSNYQIYKRKILYNYRRFLICMEKVHVSISHFQNKGENII